MGTSEILSILKLFFSSPKLNTRGSLSCRCIVKSVNNFTTYDFLITIKVFNDRKNQASRPEIMEVKLFDSFKYKWEHELFDNPITDNQPLAFNIRATIDVEDEPNLSLSNDEKIRHAFSNLPKEYGIKVSYHDEFLFHITNLKGCLTLGKARLLSTRW